MTEWEPISAFTHEAQVDKKNKAHKHEGHRHAIMIEEAQASAPVPCVSQSKQATWIWNELLLLLLFFAVFMAQEVLLRWYIYAQPFDLAELGCIALFSLFYAAVIRLLTCWLPRRGNFVVATVLMSLLTLLFAAQYIYYVFFHVPLAVYSIFNGAQVVEFAGETWQSIIAHWWQLGLLVLAPILALIAARQRMRPLKPCRALSLLVMGAVVLCCFYPALHSIGQAPGSAYAVYYNENNPAAAQERLGMLTATRLDAQRTLLGFTPKDMPQAIAIPVEEEIAEEVVWPPNALDIDFDMLVENETDSMLLAMHQYFSSVQPSLQNEYTGLFAGKNLIHITAEGFSQYLIDKELCPTIYKLATEGFEFTNMYTPIWGVSTSDGEYVAMSGLLPKSGVWSFSRSSDNYMPFALGNQFTALGYNKVIAYHNHSYTYYDRNKSHPNMGYDFRSIGHGLNVTEIWPESDVEMIENSIADYLGYAPFHVYYMTVSGHLNYNFDGNNMARRHKDDVAELPYSDEVRAYIACNLELEQMLTYLLQQLNESGQLDNTVIVLSADHYPYGLSDASLNELAGHEVERNFELYRNGLIIWQADVEHQIIDDPVCSADIIPTVSNLFGLPYDSRLLMGRDVFAPESQPLIIFNNRSWLTEKASYNSQTGVVDGDVNEDYVNAIHTLVAARLTYSAQILDNDYYRILLGQ